MTNNFAGARTRILKTQPKLAVAILFMLLTQPWPFLNRFDEGSQQELVPAGMLPQLIVRHSDHKGVEERSPRVGSDENQFERAP